MLINKMPTVRAITLAVSLALHYFTLSMSIPGESAQNYR